MVEIEGNNNDEYEPDPNWDMKAMEERREILDKKNTEPEDPRKVAIHQLGKSACISNCIHNCPIFCMFSILLFLFIISYEALFHDLIILEDSELYLMSDNRTQRHDFVMDKPLVNEYYKRTYGIKNVKEENVK